MMATSVFVAVADRFVIVVVVVIVVVIGIAGIRR
jgi:hypothetical protein